MKPFKNTQIDDLPMVPSTQCAAAIVDVRKETLARWRSNGMGPPFVQVGRYVRYPTETLLQWLRGVGGEGLS